MDKRERERDRKIRKRGTWVDSEQDTYGVISAWDEIEVAVDVEHDKRSESQSSIVSPFSWRDDPLDSISNMKS